MQDIDQEEEPEGNFSWRPTSENASLCPRNLKATEAFRAILAAAEGKLWRPAREAIFVPRAPVRGSITVPFVPEQLPDGRAPIDLPLFPQGVAVGKGGMEPLAAVTKVELCDVANGVPLDFHVSVIVGDEAQNQESSHMPTGKEEGDLSLAEAIAASMPTTAEIAAERTYLTLVPGSTGTRIPGHFKSGRFAGMTKDESLTLREAGKDKVQIMRSLGPRRTSKYLMSGIVTLGEDEQGIEWLALPADHLLSGLAQGDSTLLMDDEAQKPVACVVPRDVIGAFLPRALREVGRFPLVSLEGIKVRIQPNGEHDTWKTIKGYLEGLRKQTLKTMGPAFYEDARLMLFVRVTAVYFRTGGALYPTQPYDVVTEQGNWDVEDANKRRQIDVEPALGPAMDEGDSDSD